MNIGLLNITVRDLVKDYHDDGEGGVTGYGGKLDIRPPYQREFIYGEKERNAVIDTIRQGFPLNVMYWADIGDGRFEIIDGQQRTIAIARYVTGEFSVPVEGKPRAFHNLQTDQMDRILDYQLMVYACSGTASERLKWFEIINIAGKVLTRQEHRNAVYHGPWVSSARGYFSRRGCPAYGIGNKLLKGSAIRQDYLETAIRWIAGGDIENYMSRHQHARSAVALWNHFRSVVDWVNATFTTYRKEMRGVEWGPLYDRFGNTDQDPRVLEDRTRQLMLDDDVTSKSGIYPYLLDGDERHLSIRAFSDAMKREAFERQQGVCPDCREQFDIEEMHADHIDPWARGGRTIAANCRMRCKPCNRRKGDK